MIISSIDTLVTNSHKVLDNVQELCRAGDCGLFLEISNEVLKCSISSSNNFKYLVRNK